MDFSLIVPVHKKEKHLINLLTGVRQGSIQPSEVIIVNMGRDIDLSKFEDLSIKILKLPTEKGVPLPMALARNMGAEAAKSIQLFFLDVDCIPSVAYFETLSKQLDVYKGLIMGTPKYLMQPIKENFNERMLKDASINHPYRPVIDGCELSHEPVLFWSLCFSMSKMLFNKVGGFDEDYQGFGAEDTDLAYAIRDKGHYFFISDAVVYHQQHPVYSPPFDKFEQIIENSRVFYKKWGTWPMGNWLQTFTNRSLIDWAPHHKEINLLKYPSQELLESSYKEKAAFI